MATNRKQRRTKHEEAKVKSHKITNIGLAITSAIAVAGAPAAIHNAEVLKTEGSAILSNPMDSIDELAKRNPFWGNVALRVLCNTIGYSAVNTILWDYRKRNQVPAITSTIDWFNDTMAEKQAKASSDENFEEQGHSKLAFVDGQKMIGPYKYLFMLVTQSDDSNMQLPSPAALYDRMRQRDKERGEVLAAYDTFEMERFKESPNYQYMVARQERNKRANDVRAIKKAQDEIDHIHSELASVKYEVFDDNVWSLIPLHMQFRIVRSVYNQVTAAIVNEMEKPADERVHIDVLNELGESILLELEAANRDTEVKLAFEKNVLKVENHGLITRTSSTPVNV